MPRRCGSLRIVDDTARLWRAPETRFDCAEIGLDAFAHNIENRHLVAALESKAADTPDASTLLRRARSPCDLLQDHVEIELADGARLRAQLVVGADGRNSICREAAGIELRSSSYPQVALTYNVAHSRPHRDTSTEFHTEHGPFTLVPLPGERSSIVCVVDAGEAERMRELDPATRSISNWSGARIRSWARSRSNPAAAPSRSAPRPRKASPPHGSH